MKRMFIILALTATAPIMCMRVSRAALSTRHSVQEMAEFEKLKLKRNMTKILHEQALATRTTKEAELKAAIEKLNREIQPFREEETKRFAERCKAAADVEEARCTIQ
jgi:uncharacterized paraquat-inducible protein A